MLIVYVQIFFQQYLFFYMLHDNQIVAGSCTIKIPFFWQNNADFFVASQVIRSNITVYCY